jgi:ubiquinone/menaquinone biosynthesis C-methylase UbiE
MKLLNKKIFQIARKRIINGKTEEIAGSLYSMIEAKALSLGAEESLRFLFELENKIYQLEGRESVRYGNGVHTKHKHIKYHDFFIRNIPQGSRVLDVGCGNGALSFDIAENVPGVFVYGMDIVPENIEKAKQMFDKENIKYVCGDALFNLPDEKFDIIVLSNVLEHMDKRVDFLRDLKKRYQPLGFLVRVPVFERDWRVPLKKELGIDYRLDSTHHIEYLQEEFYSELDNAGLKPVHTEFRWGEIWCVAEPLSRKNT